MCVCVCVYKLHSKQPELELRHLISYYRCYRRYQKTKEACSGIEVQIVYSYRRENRLHLAILTYFSLSSTHSSNVEQKESIWHFSILVLCSQDLAQSSSSSLLSAYPLIFLYNQTPILLSLSIISLSSVNCYSFFFFVRIYRR